ncbi:MAG: lactate racemase domain-containing protein [Acidobacteriota bacterium]
MYAEGRNDSGLLTEDAIGKVLERGLAARDLAGRRTLVIIPDRTRSVPLPMLFRLLCEQLLGRVKKLDFLVALGTHPPLTPDELNGLVGISPAERDGRYAEVGLLNHLWNDPSTFTTLGSISRAEIEEIAGSLLAELPHDAGLLRDVPVTVNRAVHDYDHLLICGPTFPHEVVGFSGGNKYFFPGISGPEVINYTHWLGAVVSSFKIIGTRETPVRRVIDRAAAFIDRPKTCISLVVEGQGLAGIYVGSPEDAFRAAAEQSARLHIRWLDHPVRRVLSIMPRMYDDIWTAAKGMYKLEPVVETGGEVVIFAPHIEEISYAHGKLLDQIGYHVCDYFLKQWDRFRDFPGGVLAHSTHLRGLGRFDAKTGIETARIQVTLATRIPPERCRLVGLGYRHPDTVDVENWEKGGEGYLRVPKAGELLFRLREAKPGS